MTITKSTVYPGINPKALVRNLPAEEQTIAHVLATDFYITGGFKTVVISNSEYRYFFLRFPDDKANTYGVRDEIIVLLSPFENFEPRTLDAIERIQDENAGFRLDKIRGSTPFSRTVIKRLKTPDHALPIVFASVDCESAQCS